MITINVNNQPHTVQNSSSLNELLEQLQIATQGIAVAINQNIIPKTAWNETQLQAEDHILIIQATQGG
ncbi:sulfur carrier protein ThiS [Aquimarina rhabdastrellae]